MASSSSTGFQIVTHNPTACRISAVRSIYRYENEDNEQMAMLYVCNGKISYQYKGNTTPYHGICTEDHNENSMELKFDCLGRDDKLKSVVLLKRSRYLWKGWDYAGREIVLHYEGADHFCGECKVWHDAHRL